MTNVNLIDNLIKITQKVAKEEGIKIKITKNMDDEQTDAELEEKLQEESDDYEAQGE